MKATKLTGDVLVGPQPSGDDLAELSEQGVAAVVNLCSPLEEGNPTSAKEEGIQVQQLGMMYMNVPVEKDAITGQIVDDFRGKVTLLPKPVYIHCESGRRAAALALIDRGVAAGWTGEETLAEAEKLGLECDQPGLREFIKGQVDSKKG